MNADFFRSTELRFVAAVVVATGALLQLFLGVAERRGHLLLLDLTEWQPPAVAGPEAREVHRSIQSGTDAQAPFRVALRLARRPEPGDAVTIHRRMTVDADRSYCFQTMFWYDSGVRKSPIRASVLVDGERRASAPLEGTHGGGLLRVDGIRSRDGALELALEVRAVAAFRRGDWRQASTTHFEHARFWPC